MLCQRGSAGRRGIWVVCGDEMPNRQVLERVPIRRGIPGSIEQQEFDYTRHGTVNILEFPGRPQRKDGDSSAWRPTMRITTWRP